MKKLLSLTSLTAMVLLLCSGCGTMVGLVTGRPKINLTSNPSGANVTITGSNGTMFVTKTPTVVRLRRGDGYFHGAHYDVKFEMPGYQPFEASIHPSFNPWYVGNIVVGGLIGFIAVDPATGAMWNLRPNTIEANLVSTSASPSSFVPEQQNAVVAAVNVPQNSENASTPKESPK